MAAELRILPVVGLPENSMAYTNKVFVAPGEAPKTSFIKVNDLVVFAVAEHKQVPPRSLAMNALQRECCKISQGDSAKVEVWQLPRDGACDLLEIAIEVDLIGNKRRAEVREDELAPWLVERFGGHVFVRNQVFCADFIGVPLRFAVRALQLPVMKSEAGGEQKIEEGQLTKYGEIGHLVKSTVVELMAANNKLLTFEKSAASKRSPLFNPDWKFADLGIGGLDAEFGAIFRRSFASRLFPPRIIEAMGIKHVKGMLLFGPPGTGKTLIARQIGKILAQREPKIVNGPEILNKYVGASEENIRNLFAEAEADYAEKKEAADLHIIIFDEIDAICKQRGTNRGGTGVHDTVVNQLLSKIDGVNALNNILVIGMTNRKDMIDTALLRPGRLEVHVEIGLPDNAGRVQIFNIHTKKMKQNGFLGPDVAIDKLAELTKNFSGAEIEGLVKSASSYALYGKIDVTKDARVLAKADPDQKIVVQMSDFITALEEVKPAFGVDEEELSSLVRSPLISYGSEFDRIMRTCETLVHQVQTSPKSPLISILLEGSTGAGKTSIAARIAHNANFPFVKIVSPEQFVGVASDMIKCGDINKVFEDSYKSPLSIIILDDIERLIEYVPIGPRFSNPTLQTLLVLIKKVPTYPNRRLLILGTTSNVNVMSNMDIRQAFNVVLKVPQLVSTDQIRRVLRESGLPDDRELDSIAQICPHPISVKQLLMVLEMARQDADQVTAVTAARFEQCAHDAGLMMQMAAGEDQFQYNDELR